MHKKWIGLVLALLLSTLLPGALAAGDELWEQAGYDSVQAFCADYDLLYGTQTPLSQAQYDELQAVYLDALAAARADNARVPAYLAFDTMEECITVMGYADVDEACRDYAYMIAQEQFWRMQDLYYFRTRYGIDDDDLIHVQCDGEIVPFPDAKPENREGRVMVPFRAIAEAMGGTVQADGEITAVFGERSLTFRAGSGKLVTAAPAGQTVQWMDVAPYIKDDRAYVPARFFAEALGWDVAWDSNSQTVVLLDGAGLAARIDEQFTVVNHMLPVAQQDAAWRTVLSLALNVTTDMDGISARWPFGLDAELLTQDGSLHLDAQFEAGALASLIFGTNTDDEEMKPLIDVLQAALADGDLEIISNADEQTLYLRSQALMEVMSTLGAAQLPDVVDGGKIWFKISGFDLNTLIGRREMPELAQAESVGELLYQLAMENNWGWRPLETCYALDESVQSVAQLLGDNCFVQSDGAWVSNLTYDNGRLSGSLLQGEDMLRDVMADDVHTMHYRLSVRESGAYDGVLSVVLDEESGEPAGNVQLALSGDRARTHLTATLALSYEGASVDAAFDWVRTATDASVPAAPGENELVIDLSTLQGGL